MRRIAAAAVVLATALSLGGIPMAGAEEPEASTTTSSTAAAVPLVVILDISGSMNESVGSVVKLQAAKRSLEPVVRTLAGTGNVGIWTYPNAGDCGAGEYLVDVGDQTAVPEIISKLDLTQADGGTPTAAAIQAVADNLTARSIGEANLLLVSDGESNCGGIPPCEVAAGLAASGFDITIQAVGFDISEAGRAELECIAAATGGKYYDVGDGEELGDVIGELGVPQVQLSVAANEAPRSGETTTITATVTNPSALEAEDVRVNLTFADAGARTIFPAVIPPTIRLGNLPAGAVVTRSWTITAGAKGTISDAAYSVKAWSRGSSAAVVDREFTTTTEEYTAGDLGELFEGVTADGNSLVIMGDSYSSGEGTKDYLPETDVVDADCHRSSKTYLVPLMENHDIDVDILACSGAETPDFAAPRADRASAQFTQLDSLDRLPGAVVMSIGGNDVGFAEIVGKCFIPSKDGCAKDTEWMTSKYQTIAGMGEKLRTSYIETWKHLNSQYYVDHRDGRFAPVMVLSYPQITQDARFGACGNFSVEELQFMEKLGIALNAKIKASVAEVRAAGYEVYYVDSTQFMALPDRTSCSKDPLINGWQLAVNKPKVTAPESFHPNVAGFEAMTNAIVEWSTSVTRVAPSDERKLRLRGSDIPIFSTIASTVGPLLSVNASVDFDSPGSSTVQQGGQIAFTASGYEPGDVVTVQLHSTPITLTSVTADENGIVTGSTAVPDFADVGSHHLVLMGMSEDGEYLEQSVPVSVIPPLPGWLLPLIGLSIMLALAAAMLFMVAGRRKSVLPEA